MQAAIDSEAMCARLRQHRAKVQDVLVLQEHNDDSQTTAAIRGATLGNDLAPRLWQGALQSLPAFQV